MSGKTAGFVVARGLAVLIFLQAVFLSVTSVNWARSQLQLLGGSVTPWLVFISPVLFVGVAASLWFGAGRFGPETDGEDERPMTMSTALGVAIVGVSAFMICTHLAGFISFLWVSVRPRMGIDQRPPYWADVSTVIVAACLIPYGWRLAAGYAKRRHNS